MRLDLDYLESLHRDPDSVAIKDYKDYKTQNRPEIFAYDNDCRKLLKRFSWGKYREKNKAIIREMVEITDIRGRPDGQITSPAIATYSDNIIIEGGEQLRSRLGPNHYRQSTSDFILKYNAKVYFNEMLCLILIEDSRTGRTVREFLLVIECMILQEQTFY